MKKIKSFFSRYPLLFFAILVIFIWLLFVYLGQLYPTEPISPISPVYEIEISGIPTDLEAAAAIEMLQDANDVLLNLDTPHKIMAEGAGIKFLCRHYYHDLKDNSMTLYGCVLEVDDAQRLYEAFGIRFIYLPVIEKQ